MNRLTRRRNEARGLLAPGDSSDSVFSYGGVTYYPQPLMAMPGVKVDIPDGSFTSFVRQIHRVHPAISAAVVTRGHLLSQLRFAWRSVVAADNGRLFGNPDLAPLEDFNKDQTRPELLMLAEMHVSYAGNAYFHRDPDTDEIRLLNPQNVMIVMGSNREPDDPAIQLDAEVAGYIYCPFGPGNMEGAEALSPVDVAHWRPEPDPICWWRGGSWVQSLLTEFAIDRAAQLHTKAFFENAATPQMVFTYDPSVTGEQIEAVQRVMQQRHTGPWNAYKTLHVGGGADAKVVGSELNKVDLRAVTGLSETRIAVRSRVPAVILGVSEGLGGSALNAGNYNQTRRMFADGWFSPIAANLCATLAKLVRVPNAAELWYDRSQVLFLQDDRLDEATIQQQEALTIRQLIDAGFEPASVVKAVTAGDFQNLQHSGLYSVQLQEAGATTPPADPTGVPTNG